MPMLRHLFTASMVCLTSLARLADRSAPGSCRMTLATKAAFAPLMRQVRGVDEVIPLSDPGVGVGFVELGGSSIDFTVFYHCDASAAVSVPTNTAVRKAVYDALNAAKIDIPYQTVVVQQG